MEKLNLCLMILVLSIFSVKCAAESSTSRLHTRTKTFVELQCRQTRYPKLCITSLANHVNSTSQDPQEIAQVALKVSLVRAVYTKYYLMKVCKELNQTKAKDNQGVYDCFEQISNGVSQLTNSVKELQHLSLDGERAFVWHQSNVQTWLSTVLTNAFDCLDGMNSGYSMGGKVRATIKAKVLNVAQVTSNALALFNGFADRHKASHHDGYGKNKP
ncbi:PREDICTED: 21 kDa protein-like [Nicotiana attenuata]|uniref:21 kDa protein n=1 Tax=Nicotiana attenuata TaxID=49451 RepID=A0A1J6J3P4_NICAT|nr:PREDICTED: 21 kDa protein-like [Nicotiana attenuata]OIT04495.1 21 kda protein [Nicotiana attenuata]